MQAAIVFLYTRNEHAKNEMKTISFKLISKE